MIEYAKDGKFIFQPWIMTLVTIISLFCFSSLFMIRRFFYRKQFKSSNDFLSKEYHKNKKKLKNKIYFLKSILISLFLALFPFWIYIYPLFFDSEFQEKSVIVSFLIVSSIITLSYYFVRLHYFKKEQKYVP